MRNKLGITPGGTLTAVPRFFVPFERTWASFRSSESDGGEVVIY